MIRRAVLALPLLAVVGGLGVLAEMFPSTEDLPWPEAPPADGRFAARGLQAVFRFVDHVDRLRFREAAPGAFAAALDEVRRYRYLRTSPYLPADRASARRVFSVALGRVLVDADLAQVKHAGAVYEGRYALYLPTGDAVSVEVEGAELGLAAAALGDFDEVRTCDAELVVTIAAPGAAPARHRVALDRDAHAWRDLEFPLPGRATVTLEARAADGCPGRGHVFLADPTVWAPAPAPPINVLYVNVCTLRADDVGVLGQPRPATPHLDALAADGALFTRARANANWSKASQMSALIGRYPSTFGVTHFRSIVDPFEHSNFLHAAWPTLASILRARGYETAALVDNIFLNQFLHVGVDLGFARFRDDMRHIRNGVELVGEAVQWLEAHGDRPFFLYLNLANPHFRYRPPREELFASGFEWGDLVGDLQRALHLGEVRYTDRAVGRLLEAVERLGLRGRTLVVVHADHGELLDRDLEVTVRSTVRPRQIERYAPTRYKHGWTWFESEVRVPLVLALPGRVAPGTRIDRPVQLVDVAPTILDLLGIERPPTMHGQNLLAPVDPDRPVIVEGKQFRSVVVEPHKLVRFLPGLEAWRFRGDDAFVRAPTLLYDLAADPGETTPRDDPALVRRLELALDATLPATPPLHLLAFRGPDGARFRGRLTVPSRVLTVTLRGHAAGDFARVEADGALHFDVAAAHPPPVLALTAEPPLDAVTLTAEVDGRPLPPAALRLGPFGLPLAAPDVRDGRVRVDGALLRHLGVGAGQRPTWGRPAATPRIRWWTQRLAEGGPEPFSATALDAGVMDAMRAWGYAK